MSENFNLDEVVKGASVIGLAGHVRPDGDSTGSGLGLYTYLTENYPDKQVDFYLEAVNEPFKILEGWEAIRTKIGETKDYDLFFCLDCAESARLGYASELFDRAKQTVCIDHHMTSMPIGTYNYIVKDASSTSELVGSLLDMDKVSRACAEAIYMGIVHDTGVFQYSCTKPSTMIMGAKLLEKGVRSSEIIDVTFYEKTYLQNQLLGRALLESILLMDNTCIASVITQKEIDFYGAKFSDLDGIVSQLRLTKDVETAIFLYELEPHVFKVSMRSKSKVDVSEIAKLFGGGGHVRAAGFTMRGTSHDVINNICAQISMQYRRNNG